VNTIRQIQDGEPAITRRSHDPGMDQTPDAQNTDVSRVNETVVGGSGTGKESKVNAGDLPGKETSASECPAGDRVAVVAQASHGKTEAGASAGTEEQSRVTTGGAKGDRKVNASSEETTEEPPPKVPATDKQGGEAPVETHGAEPRVWSEKMLATLWQRGVKGNTTFPNWACSALNKPGTYTASLRNGANAPTGEPDA